MSMYSNNYEQICNLLIDGKIPLTKYQSKKTGMKICICEVEGPLVNGYLTFATEAYDDDGLPHTLEHLAFLGSELYPYKGVLDLLANRCLASGTNACTAVDYTCYTISTVGTEGFLNLLPIYLDHVLYPTLTEEAFITEIHHINGEGENAGVVYCEMQACENEGDNICYLEMKRAMYPGKCGYKSETGGLMKNLRESTTNQKIRDYHHAFYRPDNLCVIIIGQMDANDVFNALSSFEERIVQKGPLPDFTRPWQNPVSPLMNPVEKIVPYPCDDSEHGLVYFGWLGPSITEIAECYSLDILLQYLCDTSISPLERDFVEIDDPYCSSVTASLIENGTTVLHIDFQSVLTEKSAAIKPKLLELLTDIGTGKEELNMKRISTIIHNKKLNVLNDLEENPHHTLSELLICDFLYGQTAADLEQRIKQIENISDLAEKDADYWRELLRKYFFTNNIVMIIGEPSPALKEKMAVEEKERVAKQRENLGEEGLKRKENEFQQAKCKNEIKVPKEILLSLPIPTVDKIKFHPIKRICNYAKDSSSDGFLQDMPCCFQLDDMNTNFITMWVIMDSSSLPLDLRLYLPIYTYLIMESPILRNGELISHKEVVTELDADTLNRNTYFGLIGTTAYTCGSFPQLFSLKLKIEEEKYQKGIQWLHELLFKIEFTASRIQVILNKTLKYIAKLRRNGIWIMFCLMDSLLYSEKCNSWSCSLLRQNMFLQKIKKLLETNPNKVIENLEELRNKLTEPGNIVIHMTSNMNKVGYNSLSLWNNFIESSKQKSFHRHKIINTEEILRPLESSISQSYIVGIGSVESFYFVQGSRCISSSKDPDYPALLVLINYFTQTEGPLWVEIRGAGLSYGFNIAMAEDDGLILFMLTKCTQVVSAYKKAKNFVDNLLTGKEKWDESLLESCRSSLVYEIISEREYSITDVSFQSLMSYYKEIDRDFTRTILDKIVKVTIDDLERVGRKYLIPLFDTTKSVCGVCCNSSKVEETVAGFREMSRDLSVITNLDKSILSYIEEEISSMES